MDEKPSLGDTIILDVHVPVEFLPLTTHTFACYLRRRRADVDALITKTSPVGCVVKDASIGHVQVRMTSVETSTLPHSTPLFLTFKVTTPEANVHTLVKDTITFDP